MSFFETDPETLAPLITELRALARSARRRLPHGETLATTALVNEVYLKLSRERSAVAVDRRHFFALAARAMREILIDDARRRSARHAASTNEDDNISLAPELDAERLVDIDQTLKALADIQPRLAEVVMCRFFAGYTEEETADIIGVDVRTVQRDWKRARAWLGELTGTR